MNNARIIDDISKWLIAKAYFRDHGYSLFQFQYDVDEPEGFHAKFINSKHRDIEIVTFDQIVRDEIIGFKQ